MGLPIYHSQQAQQCPHPPPHCHRHDSRPRGWRAEGGSWERRPRGRAPPAARHTPQDRDHIFLHSHQVLHFPTFPHNSQPSSPFERRPAEWTKGDAEGWETGIVLSLGRAGQSYTRRLRGPRSYTILQDPTQFNAILHNSTRSYTILHNPSPISACLKILQLCRNPTFPCNSPQICQNLLKNSFSLETQAKPCWHTEKKRHGANILQVSIYIRSHAFEYLGCQRT